MAAVHARRAAVAQRRAHPLLEDEARRNLVSPGRLALSESRQSRRRALPVSLAAVARSDVARLYPPERRPHLGAAPGTPRGCRSAGSRRHLSQYLVPLRRVRHRRQSRTRSDGGSLLHRLLAEGQQARPPARARRTARLLRLALRRRAAVRRNRSRLLPPDQRLPLRR